jgi:transcriptional regulator with XRE-family HTH domain
MDNKNVFASNLKRYMALNGKSRNDISEALKISYFTVSDWVNGKKYPRMDKVEMLANYFGIQKSDLIEDKEEQNSPEEPKLTEGEKLWLELYHRLSDESRDMMITMMDSLDRIPKDKQQFALQAIRFALGYQE